MVMAAATNHCRWQLQAASAYSAQGTKRITVYNNEDKTIFKIDPFYLRLPQEFCSIHNAAVLHSIGKT